MGFSFKETDVLSACLEYLSFHGILAWRTNNTAVYDPARQRYRAFRGLKGVADILGIIPQTAGSQIVGLFLAIEVKKPGGRKSAEQDLFLEAIRQRGGIAICVKSLKELEEQLKPYLPAEAA